jgi:AcrR family transcriptional regulator
MAEKDQHRIKIKRKFIDITNDIIMSNGIEAVSIRKIAALAKYNSATIYLYFDNLNHLLFLSSLSGTREYVTALTEIGNKEGDSLGKLIEIWNCFVHYSFQKPKIFSTIFFNDTEGKAGQYMQEYYELYPEEVSAEDSLAYKLIFDHDLKKRVHTLTSECAKEGYFKEEDLNDLSELLLFAYKGMLEKVIKGSVKVDEALEQKTMYYIKKVLEVYADKSKKLPF